MQASVGVFMLSKLCNLEFIDGGQGKKPEVREKGSLDRVEGRKGKGFHGKKAWEV